MPCFRLRNQIQHYAWGSRTFLAELRGSEPGREPEAELWIGAHPALPSQVELDGGWTPLDRAISEHPERLLGSFDSDSQQPAASSTLPILLKILAIRKPLSLQAHPTADQALAGFEREQASGLKVDHPKRNYRDPYAKPEVICALSAFEALSGFRPPEDVANDLGLLGLLDLLPIDLNEALPLESFFTRLCRLEDDRVDELLKRTQQVDCPAGSDQLLAQRLAWTRHLNETYPRDRAVVSPLFLNLVQLQPGECLFTRAGTLHTYLDGAGVELMTSSDNVLRAGLTAKHLDTEELLQILDFESRPPTRPRLAETSPGRHTLEETGATFGLDRLTVDQQLMLETSSRAELWLCAAGRSQVKEPSGATSMLSAGDGLLVAPPQTTLQVVGPTTLFRAHQIEDNDTETSV